MPARRTTALTATGRAEGLSDATFAIVTTLLVLQIHRPSTAPGQLAQVWPASGPPTWRTPWPSSSN
jgi:uncharacterized membrane protein